jgi:hypothetical protein
MSEAAARPILSPPACSPRRLGAATLVAVDAWQETDGKAELLALVGRAVDVLSEQLR